MKQYAAPAVIEQRQFVFETKKSGGKKGPNPPKPGPRR